mgnify:CR=1 FL=1
MAQLLLGREAGLRSSCLVLVQQQAEWHLSKCWLAEQRQQRSRKQQHQCRVQAMLDRRRQQRSQTTTLAQLIKDTQT